MNVIVTTTINEPTVATIKFCELTESLSGWEFLIVGDRKTPHDSYRALEARFPGVQYLQPQEQETLFPELSATIGWDCIQRRNVGFAYAYACGAEVVATVDDDNVPYDLWGQDLKVGREVEYDDYQCTACEYFDPLAITRDNHLWHRGYPIQCLQQRHELESRGARRKLCLVQANLWDGDPDIDALARLTFKPLVNYDEITAPFGSTQLAPFNSQNTLLHRSVLPFYVVLPHIGRMDDVWGSYILQRHFPNAVVYDRATVYQDRNEQDLVTNLEDELLGYRQTLELLQAGETYEGVLPEGALAFWRAYRSLYETDSFVGRVQQHRLSVGRE